MYVYVCVYVRVRACVRVCNCRIIIIIVRMVEKNVDCLLTRVVAVIRQLQADYVFIPLFSSSGCFECDIDAISSALSIMSVRATELCSPFFAG